MATRLQAIDEQIEKLKARRAQIQARDLERERKRDTRRKIIIGAGLLKLVRHGDVEAVRVYGRIRGALDEREAKPFEGWEPERSRATDGDGS